MALSENFYLEGKASALQTRGSSSLDSGPANLAGRGGTEEGGRCLSNRAPSLKNNRFVVNVEKKNKAINASCWETARGVYKGAS